MAPEYISSSYEEIIHMYALEIIPEHLVVPLYTVILGNGLVMDNNKTIISTLFSHPQWVAW